MEYDWDLAKRYHDLAWEAYMDQLLFIVDNWIDPEELPDWREKMDEATRGIPGDTSLTMKQIAVFLKNYPVFQDEEHYQAMQEGTEAVRQNLQHIAANVRAEVDWDRSFGVPDMMPAQLGTAVVSLPTFRNPLMMALYRGLMSSFARAISLKNAAAAEVGN